MGVNISLEKLDGTDHPDWDSFRHAGDREIADLIEANGGFVYSKPDWTDELPMCRPADLEALARARWPADNEARWILLQRILRDEPDYWMDFSW